MVFPTNIAKMSSPRFSVFNLICVDTDRTGQDRGPVES